MVGPRAHRFELHGAQRAPRVQDFEHRSGAAQEGELGRRRTAAGGAEQRALVALEPLCGGVQVARGAAQLDAGERPRALQGVERGIAVDLGLLDVARKIVASEQRKRDAEADRVDGNAARKALVLSADGEIPATLTLAEVALLFRRLDSGLRS